MISGLVVLDKPSGMTSFDCVESVQRIFGVRKAGHTGTLDPKVTGVLLILIGEARKLAPLFEKMDKTYVGVMHLHKETDSKKLNKVLEMFRGEIRQLPPKRSRVARVERKRKIHKLEIKEIEGKDVTLEIKCEHGTYIRKLFSDIGEKLGVGAHMKCLRRTSVDDFSENEAIVFEQLKKDREKCLISNEAIVSRLRIKKILVDKEDEKKVRNGVPLEKNKKIKTGERVAIFVGKKLRAIGTASENRIKIDRVLLDK